MQTQRTWRLAGSAVTTLILFLLLMGLVKLSGPWTMATADLALQDDRLFEEAKALSTDLDLGLDKPGTTVEGLKSVEAAQSVLEELPADQPLMLMEAGDTWAVRTRERLRGWACAGYFNQWLIGDKDLCSWAGGGDAEKATAEQLDVVAERLSVTRSANDQTVSIGFRSADLDLSIAMATTFGDLLIARREAAKQALRRRIDEWIVNERVAMLHQRLDAAGRQGRNEEDIGGSQAEIQLFHKVAKAIESATDDMTMRPTFKMGKAPQTGMKTSDGVAGPSVDKAMDQQISETEQDRAALSNELAKMKAAFEGERSEGDRDSLLTSPSSEPPFQSEQDAYAALTRSEFSLLMHPDWAKPAAVLIQPAKATGLTTIMAAAIAMPLAIFIGVALALFQAVVRNRSRRRALVEESLYANPYWPSVQSPQQVDLELTA